MACLLACLLPADLEGDSDELGSSDEEEDEEEHPVPPASKKAAKQQQAVAAAAPAAGKRKQAEQQQQEEEEASDSDAGSSDDEGGEDDDEEFSEDEISQDEEKEEEEQAAPAAGRGKQAAAAAAADAKAASGGGKKSGGLQSEFEEHKAQLEALQKQDPEFYAYLQVSEGWRVGWWGRWPAAGGWAGRLETGAGAGAGLLQSQCQSCLTPYPRPGLLCLLCCLQSTDQELLNFGQDSDDEVDRDDELGLAQAEEEDGEGDEEAGAEEQGGVGPQGKQGKERSGVTLAMVDGWCTAARDKASIGAMRHIIKVRAWPVRLLCAFVCACMCLYVCVHVCACACVGPAL